jgi:hypothetical protein
VYRPRPRPRRVVGRGRLLLRLRDQPDCRSSALAAEHVRRPPMPAVSSVLDLGHQQFEALITTARMSTRTTSSRSRFSTCSVCGSSQPTPPEESWCPGRSQERVATTGVAPADGGIQMSTKIPELRPVGLGVGSRSPAATSTPTGRAAAAVALIGGPGIRLRPARSPGSPSRRPRPGRCADPCRQPRHASLTLTWRVFLDPTVRKVIITCQPGEASRLFRDRA